VNHARILLLSNSGKSIYQIAETLCVNRNTVLGVRKRYLSGGMASALHDAERSGQPKKYGDSETSEIIALACSSPPEGRKRWTVRLIVEEMKKKEGFEGINRESVRLILKKQN
jgi:transposase